MNKTGVCDEHSCTEELQYLRLADLTIIFAGKEFCGEFCLEVWLDKEDDGTNLQIETKEWYTSYKQRGYSLLKHNPRSG